MLSTMTTIDPEGTKISGDSTPDNCQDKDPSQSSSEPLQPELSEKSAELVENQEWPTSTPGLPNSAVEASTELATENIHLPVVESTPTLTHPPQPVAETKDVSGSDKKKEDDKLGIYKALAIKLKKELVKSRDELQRIREDDGKERFALNQKIKALEENLETLQQTSATTIVTLESKVKSLKEQLDISELDLQNLQDDFENYKVRASKIMQQNNSTLSVSNKTFEEDRYRQLKELNDEQLKRISILESQLSVSLNRNHELERERKFLQEELELLNEKLKSLDILGDKYETLSRENKNLKLALKQFRTKLREPMVVSSSSQNCDEYPDNPLDTGVGENVELTQKLHDNILTQTTASNSNLLGANQTCNSLIESQDQQDDVITISPSTSIKDDPQTNSSSSYDGSTSGYVHIKPTTFEIISRATVHEEAQHQIDNLTKAYLDSENTNSLLSDQVRALKEEIRRLQLRTERMHLAENLEYLKNVVFKFISLDSGQMEQKQRLVPVLSTVLKLSPDETAKLNSLAMASKPSMASSFFKL